MAGAQLICPNCKFTFTLPAQGLAPRVACPMCRTPIPTGPSAGSAPGTPPRRQGPHGFDRPDAFARPESPTARGAQRPPPPTPPPSSPEGPGTPPEPLSQAPTWDDFRGAPAGAGATLVDPGTLLSMSWASFKERVGPLLGLNLLAVLMAMVPIGAGAGIGAVLSSGEPGGIAVGLAAGGVAALWSGSWGFAAFLLAVVDDELGVGEALRAARPRAWSFAWIAVILGFVLTGGTLLFVIPGIVFGVWFTFAPFAFTEGASGMAALLRSRALVAGHGWAVLGRLLLVALVGALVGAVPGLGPILSLLFGPFQALYIRHLFDDLRGKKPNARVASPGAETARILGGAAAGFVAVPVMILAIASGPGGGLGTFMKVGLAALQGDPEAAAAFTALAAGLRDRGAAAPPANAPPFEFARGIGVWRGTAGDTGAEWTVTMAAPDRVEVRESDGEFYAGRARALWGLGEEGGSLRVLPGGALFDVVVEESSDPAAAGRIMLGSWKLEGGGALKLCLGQPGATDRTADFASEGFLCLALERDAERALPEAAPPPAGAVEATAPAEGQVEREAGAEELFGDLSVYIYAVNYKGTVMLNGRELQRLEGERDLQYTFNLAGDGFRKGENTLSVSYRALPDPLELQLEIRVTRLVEGQRKVLGEWKFADPEGNRTWELEL